MRSLIAKILVICSVVLFKPPTSEASKPEQKSHVMTMTETKTNQINSNAIAQLTAAINEPEGMSVYISHGNWSLPTMLKEMLAYTGPDSTVYIATWSITERPIEQLAYHIRSGAINHLHILTDHRSKLRAEQGLAFASNFAKIDYRKSHAKILLVIGQERSVGTVGSANFTRNPRSEAGLIFHRPEIIDFYRHWFEC